MNVYESKYRNKYSKYASKGTIYWNPNLGLKTDNGIVLSPASAFDHEADHAVNQKIAPVEFEQNEHTKDAQYDDKEERRVITNSEQKTARANGEINQGQVTRRNHRGNYVITEGVTSANIDNQKTKEYEKENQRWTSEDK